MTKDMDPYGRVSHDDPALFFQGRDEFSFGSKEREPSFDVEFRNTKESMASTITALGERRESMSSETQRPPSVPVQEVESHCDLEHVVEEGESPVTEKHKGPPQPCLAPTTTGATETPQITRLAKLIWKRKWKEAQVLLMYGKQGSEDAALESCLPGLGGSMGLPLHLACTMRPLPPASFIERLINAYPQACRQQQRTWGLLPLHLAADLSLHKKAKGFKIPKQQRSRPTNNTLEERDDVEVVDVSTYLEESTKALETSNHLYIIRFLIRTYPESIYVRENTNGMLPIHIAASTARSENGIVTPTSAAVLETLLQAAPATKDMVDGYGDTPVALAWRETIFCCYQCGRKGSAPCLCKNRLLVATEYLHPLLREQIQAISKPSQRAAATTPGMETSPKSVVVSNLGPGNSPVHRAIHERQSSWDSEMTVKVNNYTKTYTSHAQKQPTDPRRVAGSSTKIPARITTAPPRNITPSQGAKKCSAPNDSKEASQSSTKGVDFEVLSSHYQTPPTSPFRQPSPLDATMTPTPTPPNSSTRGRQLFRGGTARSISPPKSRNYFLPDPVALKDPVRVPLDPQEHRPQRPLRQIPHNPLVQDATIRASENPKSTPATCTISSNKPLLTASSPNHRLPRSAMELRPRIATPPEMQRWEHFEPTSWLLQPDVTNDQDESPTMEEDSLTKSWINGRGQDTTMDKNVDLVPPIQTNQIEEVPKKMSTPEPSTNGTTSSSPQNRNWSMLVCQRHDGDYGHDMETVASQKSSPISDGKASTKSLSPIYSTSPRSVSMENQSPLVQNNHAAESPGVVNQELALVQVLHIPSSSPATSATATDSSSSSTSSKPERDRMTRTHIPVPRPKPSPSSHKRQILRIQVRFSDLRRPINSKYPKRPPNPYFQLYITNGTSVASVYQSRPLMKRTEGTWEEAAIDISSNPKAKHLPKRMEEGDDNDDENNPSSRSPKFLDHHWRIGFRVIHCQNSNSEGKVLDAADPSNVIGLCRTSLDKLQAEPKQAILHGFQVMGWLEVTYLAVVQ